MTCINQRLSGKHFSKETLELDLTNGHKLNKVSSRLDIAGIHGFLLFYRHTNPVQVLPGDILRITCVYDTREVKHPVHWGLLSTNEICASTIEFYPKGNWMGSTCSSFKSIPLCKLETTGVANGCDFNGFFGALHKDVRTAALFQNCTDMNFCTPACRTLANAATSHPCLTGDSMELLRSPLTAPNKKLKVFFNVLELCGAYTPPKHPQHRRPRKNQNNDTQESMSSGIGGSLPGHLVSGTVHLVFMPGER